MSSTIAVEINSEIFLEIINLLNANEKVTRSKTTLSVHSHASLCILAGFAVIATSSRRVGSNLLLYDGKIMNFTNNLFS